jgi:hypothetical protein
MAPIAKWGGLVVLFGLPVARHMVHPAWSDWTIALMTVFTTAIAVAITWYW